MTELEIRRQWEADRPVYQAWGELVRDEICTALESILAPQSLSEFLKLPVEPRLKDPRSLVDKALFRGKEYKDPYGDITDKVGVRFVVLLTTDIRKVEQVICNSEKWSASKDRDYEEEREARPLEFTYQSVHYVVRASRALKIKDRDIPAGIPCEIQVRTLLQHAHCELSHDSVYKAKKAAPPRIHRALARSIALIEAADDFFETAMEELKKGTEREREVVLFLVETYRTLIGREPDMQKSNFVLIERYFDGLNESLPERLSAFLEKAPYVRERIIGRFDTNHLYRQPVILAVYLMAASSPALTKELWPLTVEELRPVYRDLGLSIDDH